MVLSIASCKSTEKLVLEGDARIRATDAIELLSSDMLTSVVVDIPTERLYSALPVEYTVYEDYVPLYSLYRDQYLGEIANVLEDTIPSLYDSIYSYLCILAANPELYITEDTSLTTDLANIYKDALVSELHAELSRRTGDFAFALSDSKTEFDSIKKAYENLDVVDSGSVIPDVLGVNIYQVAVVGVDILLLNLSEMESELKNRVVDRNSDTLYSIFWEGR